MQVKLFTKSSNDEVRIQVRRLVRELHSERVEPTVIDVDTPDGAAAQELYDVVSYPTIVVTTDDGREVAAWHGAAPPVADVRYALGHI